MSQARGVKREEHEWNDGKRLLGEGGVVGRARGYEADGER